MSVQTGVVRRGSLALRQSKLAAPTWKWRRRTWRVNKAARKRGVVTTPGRVCFLVGNVLISGVGRGGGDVCGVGIQGWRPFFHFPLVTEPLHFPFSFPSKAMRRPPSWRAIVLPRVKPLHGYDSDVELFVFHQCNNEITSMWTRRRWRPVGSTGGKTQQV